MCSYYRKFIKGFSIIADTLTSLIKNNVPFTWTENQEKAFQTLKVALINPPILGYFDPNATTYIHTDASNIGLGATLVQKFGDNETVISYLSRTLSKPEQNYSTTEKECLAVVWSMSKIGIGFVDPLPSTKRRRKWIIVLTDYYTKSNREKVSAFIIEHIILRHRAPRFLISDRGSQFTSNLMKEVMKMCKVFSVGRFKLSVAPESVNQSKSTINGIKKLDPKYKLKINVDKIRTFEALVDTGADLSVVDLRTVLDTGHGISKLEKNCGGPDGKKLDMVGSIFLIIKIDDKALLHKFVMLKMHLQTLILGRDFLKKMKAKIDCKQETIKYDLTNNHNESNFEMLKIKSAKDSIVPECSIKLIKALVETEDGEYIIEESSKMFQTNGLRLARSLINVINREKHIWITNPYPRPLKIMKNRTLAFGSSPAKINVSQEREVEENEEPRFQISKNLSPKEQKELKQVLERYGDLFSSRLGRTNLAKHRIDIEDAKPIKHNPYRVRAKERDIIKEQIDEMLTEGIIRPSSSPWSFPKRDGKYIFCVDYRKLNNVTVKDVYPIPRIDEVMDALQGSTYFSAIDLRSGYWHVEVEERDKEKTAFTTTHGLYEFNVMPFVLCNAPVTFERNMENMLGNLRWQICSDITSKHGIKPAEHNIKAVRNFPRPTKVKEVQSFLGIPPILGHFNPNAPTYIHTDASNIGIGATLVQDIGGEEKVISYLCRTLSKVEQNYSTTEKECLAVVWSMSKLRPYLYGRHFKINPQQSQARLQSDQLHHRVQRASETPQQSQTRQEADRTMVSGLECAVLQGRSEALRTLLDGSSPHSAEFMQHVHHYNNTFQMTSFGCGSRVVLPGYMPTFKVQGQVYHRIGSVLPLLNSDSRQLQPAFLQVFFIGDSSAEVATRHGNFPITKPHIVSILQDMLHRHNPYVHLFKASIEKMPSPDYKLVVKADKAPPGHHPRSFNAPTINGVVIVIVQENCDRRDIVLSKRGSGVQRINEFHRSYDALQYPFVFWNGQDGYHFHIPQLIDGVHLAHKTVYCMDFYASLLMIRSRNPGITNWLLAFGDLTHLILVDIYAKVESEKLHYISAHQAQLRATEYINLLDAIRTDRSHALNGRQVILPSSFVGSPRHMHEYAQDCMAYVHKYGRPDLFITFTCNPE
ncbi:hypothetical protein LAZ67_12002534 [Cordylochernes scorpioides]|uniref:Peptidase A2 domain-containing protein n=1 Tax=Cordylochernes scorpioides TaxID=51811 RepID=A0ABY6L1U4_9ARAC|nr:hypothetical protein LAZ67_12002534 [Cordylochernes scorpioides]